MLYDSFKNPTFGERRPRLQHMPEIPDEAQQASLPYSVLLPIAPDGIIGLGQSTALLF